MTIAMASMSARHSRPHLSRVVREQVRAAGKLLAPFNAAIAAIWAVYDVFMIMLSLQLARHVRRLARGRRGAGFPCRTVEARVTPIAAQYERTTSERTHAE